MEIDTGASYSIISGATHKRLWPQNWLMPTTVKLHTYTGKPLTVKGSMMAQVHCGDKELKLSLLMLMGDSPSLLGRDWLQHLKLDWKQINKLHSEALQWVLQRHEDIFKPGVSPWFCKAHSFPYFMVLLLEKELDRLVAKGRTEPVQFADWKVPIVPVLKQDKVSVRICGLKTRH